MIAIPAVDLREGACVQLVGGEYAQERVRLADPAAVAREWVRLGFARLHVVDLDAALGKGNNLAIVREILREGGADVQVGGGLRTTDAVDDILNEGARYAIVGTRALEDLDREHRDIRLGEPAPGRPPACAWPADRGSPGA